MKCGSTIALTLIAAGVLAGCGAESMTLSPNPPIKIGEPYDLSGSKVTANIAMNAPLNEERTASGKCVGMVIENTGSKAWPINLEAFELTNPDGTKVLASPVPIDDGLSPSAVPAGGTSEGRVCFDDAEIPGDYVVTYKSPFDFELVWTFMSN